MKKFTFEAVDGFSVRLLHYTELATKIAQAVYAGDHIVLFSDMALPVCYMYLDKRGFHLLDAYGRNIVELGDEFVGEHGVPDVYSLLLYIYTFVDVVDYEEFFWERDEDERFYFYNSYSLSLEARKIQQAAKTFFTYCGVLPHPFTFEDYYELCNRIKEKS